MDFPAAFFYKDLMKAFPKAKVILTVREPDKWYKSVKETILKGYELLQQWPLTWMAKLRLEKERKEVRKCSSVAEILCISCLLLCSVF